MRHTHHHSIAQNGSKAPHKRLVAPLTDSNQRETHPIASHRTVRRNAPRLRGRKRDLREGVVYDLFREFSQPTLKHRSLFCCLSSHEQIPERFTALLALKHPDVPLFAPHLLMKAFHRFVVRMREASDSGKSIAKYDKVFAKSTKKFATASGSRPFHVSWNLCGPLPDVSRARTLIDLARIGQEGFFSVAAWPGESLVQRRHWAPPAALQTPDGQPAV